MAARTRISTLEAHLGYWLRYVSNQVSYAFSAKLARHDVTAAEWVVLRTMYDAEAVAPSALAQQLGMTRGAISKLAERLMLKKLIVRRSNGADRRFQSLTLTIRGQKLVPTLAALADDNDAGFFGHLDRASRAALIETMKDIVDRHDLRAVPIS